MLKPEFTQSQKEKLLEEKKKLVEELKFVADRSKDNPQNFEARFENLGDDQDSNAQEVANYAQELAIEQGLENILDKINNALERIEKGTYEKCKEGDEIQPERLEAIPWADTCIKHSA